MKRTMAEAQRKCSARADWRPEKGRAAPDPARLAKELLEPFGIDLAILNPVHGASSHPNSYFAQAACRAVNGWLADTWLAKDDRLRGAISVPIQEPDMAVDIREEEGRLILTPAREPTYDLASLLEGITPDNRHDGVDSGEPQGLEAL